MKKVIILAIAAVLTMGASCKHGEKCPAYGKAPVKSTTKRI
ncbi:MAG: hypothetical protein K0S33_2295 [Bacteroidetes bacterium]|jgi:hypothetical protein|nr:hypothetical protein [Bacteroidota bacterium]